MTTLVVKLGSSIVADDRGEVRTDVLAGVCDEAARRHAEGDELVLVTSGAIARGMRLMELPVRPVGDGRAPGGLRGRPGQALPRLRRAAPGARRAQRAGAAHVLRHVGAHPLPQRAPHAAQAARLARGAGDQRERHDHHGRHLVRRQRLPGRPGGDPARRRAAGAADRHRGPVHGRPAPRPAGRAHRRGQRLRVAPALRHRRVELSDRLGRHALEGRGRGDGDGGRDPGDHHERHRPRGGGAGARAAASRAPASTPRRARGCRASSSG